MIKIVQVCEKKTNKGSCGRVDEREQVFGEKGKEIPIKTWWETLMYDCSYKGHIGIKPKIEMMGELDYSS